MDKKSVNILLAAIAVGVLGFIIFRAVTGGFAGEQVYADPQGIAEAQGDARQTALNYNALGFRIISANKDMCISPNMLASNIGLYAEGAVEEGREQAEIMLGAEENLKENHAALVHALMADKPSHDYFFSGLFMDKGVNPKEAFVEANNYYGTYFETVDFFDFTAVRDKINSLASSKTEGNITQATGEIYAKSSMIFVSALRVKEYFGGDVGAVYKTADTFMGNQTEFYNMPNARIMLYEDDNVLFMGIPLENNYNYEVVMAKNGNLGGMTLADIKNYRDSAKETAVNMLIPVPKIEAQYELKDALKAVGFEAPFSKTTLIANLTDSAKIKVDKIDQNISFELLPKEGIIHTDAVAKKNVTIDKPYYYMFSHRTTGCNTMMGKKSM